jgi:hypothetical protein
MIILIDRQFQVHVKEPKDFKNFKVQVDSDAASFDALRSAVAHVVTFDDAQTAWVSASVLCEWPQLHDDPEWRSSLQAMIAKARPHGWIKETPLSIRAHIEWTLLR